jgi:four helix bundle protein
MKKYDLEERLIRFSIAVIVCAEKIPKSFSGRHLSEQLIRSATAPALQYGEAQAAESRNDFIHKMKIALKELRETLCCIKIISRAHSVNAPDMAYLLTECNELVAIFVKSISTATQNKALH